MPGDGKVQAFAFGRSVGVVRGVLEALGVPVDEVAPNVWKPAMRVPAEKDKARARASYLLPSAAKFWPLKKHDGRAEAALIGLYAFQRGLAVRPIEW